MASIIQDVCKRCGVPVMLSYMRGHANDYEAAQALDAAFNCIVALERRVRELEAAQPTTSEIPPDEIGQLLDTEVPFGD